MLNSVEVTHYQSLESAKVVLGPLTVLVGPSSSGKSAFLRAIRTLVRNTTSPAAVTHGAKSFTLAADFEGHVVSLQRGKALSTYAVSTGESVETYPKAGKDVPAEVAQVLSMPLVEGQDLHFAFQFDAPFLLAEAPALAAKVLGDLTNINLLVAAVREANRRKLEAAKVLKVRRSDVVALSERVQTQFAHLPARKAEVLGARADFEEIHGAAERLAALSGLINDLSVLQAAHKAACEALSASDGHYQGLDGLESDVRSWVGLRSVITELVTAAKDAKAAQEAVAAAEAATVQAEDAYTAALVGAGTCPTCGQRTEELNHESHPAAR